MKYVFVDKDGTLIQNVPYNCDPNKINFNMNIIEIVQSYISNGYTPVIITNQSGIGRGYFSEDNFRGYMDELLRELQKMGIETTYRFCPHSPHDNCVCRKPLIGMVDGLQIDPDSVMIGDTESDFGFAENLGIKYIGAHDN